MKTKRSVRALLRKQLGKDAAAILSKVDKMLKQGVSRVKIEKMLAAELIAHAKKQIEHAHHGMDEIMEH